RPPPSRSAAVPSTRDNCHAGSAPKTNPLRADTPRANSRTVRSSEASCSRGLPVPPIAIASFTRHPPLAAPPPPALLQPRDAPAADRHQQLQAPPPDRHAARAAHRRQQQAFGEHPAE